MIIIRKPPDPVAPIPDDPFVPIRWINPLVRHSRGQRDFFENLLQNTLSPSPPISLLPRKDHRWPNPGKKKGHIITDVSTQNPDPTPPTPPPPPDPPVGSWVSNSGNNANPGTFAQPWQTFAYAVSQITSWTSRTLNVVGNGNIYPEFINNWPTSGNPGNPYIVQGYFVTTRPVFKPNNDLGAADRIIGINGKKDLTFKNLILDAALVTGNGTQEIVKVQSLGGVIAERVIFENCVFQNARCNESTYPFGAQGVLCSAGSSNCRWTGCSFTNNGTNHFAHGIYMQAPNNIIEGCDASLNGGYGIHAYSTVGENDNLIVRNNIIHDNETAGITDGGITTTGGNNIQVYNNIVYNEKHGIRIRFGSATDNLRIYFNTMFNCSMSAVDISSIQTNCQVKNNIGYQTNAIINDAPATLAGNLFTGANPLFVNSGANDFHLQAGSPALGIGVDVGIYVDAEGNPRPVNNSDAGALERP
jgi:hypothetical protein